MSFLNSKNIIIIFISIIILAFAAFLIFNKYGLLKYLALKQEKEVLEERILLIEKENLKYQQEIDSLEKKIPAKIEQIARERYGMLRKNERVIIIEEK